MRGGKKRESSLFVQVFDVVFVMGLCFLTLLTTILWTGKVLTGSEETGGGLDYSFNLWTFVPIVVCFLVYMGYLLRHSERELKEMVEHVYGPAEETEGTKAPVEGATDAGDAIAGLEAPVSLTGKGVAR